MCKFYSRLFIDNKLFLSIEPIDSTTVVLPRHPQLSCLPIPRNLQTQNFLSSIQVFHIKLLA